MERTLHVAVVGATGLVGQEMLRTLEDRSFPAASVRALASEKSAGTTVEYAGESLTVQRADADAFAGVDIVLMSAGSAASLALAPAAVAAGAIVIDNSSAWRMAPDVPLVVPEVNGALLDELPDSGIVANPNCATIQLVVALAPLHAEAALRRVVASTYQAVSGRGQAGIRELGEQVAALFNSEEFAPKAFARRIAFNCLPQIDVLDAEDGSSGEEAKIVAETRKILRLPELDVVATCVRVPVFNGHAISVLGEFDAALDAARAREVLRGAPGVLLMDDAAENVYPTSIDAEGQDATLVGRVRQGGRDPRALALWCVADNLRKGAATNAVQIAERVARVLVARPRGAA